ncbi:MAG TPA: sulfatase-like hydrolase/transferase, partial [Vicinamibacteria bacterium]|nr:sulfatase-like hydrolase/transferase [Vicinamibacteria bacterium]
QAAVFVVLAAGLPSLGGCSRPRAPVAARHLVLVTIDTLRADRLSCYGSAAVATPHLDRIAAAGALAKDASVQAPLTRPSHVSILTGLYPAEHGIRDNVSPALAPEVPTLAERLKGQGFSTAAFVSSIVLSRQSGLARGFDTYSDRFEVGADDARFLNTIQRRGDGPTAEAIAWLAARKAARTFVWLHLYDPHDPYEPPAPYAAQHAEQPYDGEVAWSDELVGRLDAALERLGLAKETLLVVTSDHGEGLGEHGEAVHGFFVYESTLAVPLLMRGPGIPGGTRVTTTVRSVDLLPTVLELLGTPAPPGRAGSGRSVAAAFRGGPAPGDEATYAESLTPLLHFGWSDLRALRDGRFKYVLAPRPELYDLREDPKETRNLVSESPAKAEALRAELARRLEAERSSARAPASAGAVPPELLEQLGALGYVGAGSGATTKTPGADPKDKLEDYKVVNAAMREGLTLLREKDPAGAASRFRSLLRRGIASFEVHYYLARALLALGDFRAARPHFEGALERLPAYGPAYTGLADCHLALGDPMRALATLGKGQSVSPRDARLFEAEAAIQRQLERPREAIAAYETAARLAPKDALLRVKLGEVYRDTRQADKAIAIMREAVGLDPEPAEYWNALGMVLGGSERLTEAETAFREAVKRNAAEPQYAYNLGLVLMRQGRRDEARPHFRTALELEPRFAAARARLAEMGRQP